MSDIDIAQLSWLIEKLEEGDLDSIIKSKIVTSEQSRLHKRIQNIAVKTSTYLDALQNQTFGAKKEIYPVQSKFDIIGKAVSKVLEEMHITRQQAIETKLALEEETNKLHQEDWIKTQFTQIFSALQGVKSLSELGNLFLDKIAFSLNIQLGTFYVASIHVEHEKKDNSLLTIVGSYGCTVNPEKTKVFDSETLVGQSIKSRRTLLTQVPASGYSNIETSLVTFKPEHIIIIPVIYENEIYGAFELATVFPFSESIRNLLEQLASYLGISIKNISNIMLTEKLLDEIKKTNNSLEKQKQALDSSAIVAETDLRGRITYVNDKFLEISKYSKSDLLGQDHRILNSQYHPKEFFIDLWKTIAKGNVWKGEVRNRAKDGSFYWVDTTVCPVKDETGKTQKYVAIRFDITYRKEIEEKLIQTSESAKKAAQAKADFLANMSHEIRTPLNAIIGLSDVLLETQLSDEQQKYLSTLRDSGDTLLSIVNDVLDISKIESGQLEVEHVEYDIENLIEQVFEMMSNRAAAKGLEVFYDFDPRIPAQVFGDPLRLRQVLMNLIGNAIKFTTTGSVSLHVNQIEKTENAAIVEFAVTDTGVGIAPENIEKIFNSFEQADTSVTRQYGGTGLGLSIVKRLVEKKRGTIHVVSQPDKGSTFVVRIPIEYNPLCLIKKSNIEHLIDGKKVLVVDDSDGNRLVLRKTLESWGAQVDEAASGEQALEVLKSEKRSQYNVVVLDSRMPGLSGFEVLEKIHADKEYAYQLNDILILMLTSDHRAGDLKRAKELGISTYVIKPIKKTDLKIALRKVLKRPSRGSVLIIDMDSNSSASQNWLSDLDMEMFVARNENEALWAMQTQKIDLILADSKLVSSVPGYDLLQRIRHKQEKSSIILLASPYVKSEADDLTKILKITAILNRNTSKDLLVNSIQQILESQKLESPESGPDNASSSLSLNILAVEDSERNRSLLTAYFKDTKHTVTYAVNGKEAVDKISNSSFDIVLMDMQMPIMDGYQATKIIRENELKKRIQAVPIIALTANALSGEKEKSLAAGCSFYLSKPIRKKDLMTAIDTTFKRGHI